MMTEIYAAALISVNYGVVALYVTLVLIVLFVIALICKKVIKSKLPKYLKIPFVSVGVFVFIFILLFLFVILSALGAA